MANDKNSYFQFLIARGRTKNVASAYVAGINKISRHCGEDVFGIADPKRLEKRLSDYRQGGAYGHVGNQLSGAAKTALRCWAEISGVHEPIVHHTLDRRLNLPVARLTAGHWAPVFRSIRSRHGSGHPVGRANDCPRGGRSGCPEPAPRRPPDHVGPTDRSPGRSGCRLRQAPPDAHR